MIIRPFSCCLQTFLGDKYGFRPLPADMEEPEFKLIKNTAVKLGQDTTLLQTWYLCDYNREPTMFSLQPISTLYPHYFDMTPANASLRQQVKFQNLCYLESSLESHSKLHVHGIQILISSLISQDQFGKSQKSIKYVRMLHWALGIVSDVLQR